MTITVRMFSQLGQVLSTRCVFSFTMTRVSDSHDKNHKIDILMTTLDITVNNRIKYSREQSF